MPRTGLNPVWHTKFMFTIKVLEPKEFDAEMIEWLYDERGKLRGAIITQTVTREELEKLYGPVEQTDSSTAF